MTSWADVALAIAGAPVGAGIAVLGTHLSNRSQEKRENARLAAETTAATEARRAEYRAAVVKKSHDERLALYTELAEFCVRLQRIPALVEYDQEMTGTPGPDHTHFRSTATTLDSLYIRAVVHAPTEVVLAMDVVGDALGDMGDDPTSDEWAPLLEALELLRNTVRRAAQGDVGAL